MDTLLVTKSRIPNTHLLKELRGNTLQVTLRTDTNLSFQIQGLFLGPGLLWKF